MDRVIELPILAVILYQRSRPLILVYVHYTVVYIYYTIYPVTSHGVMWSVKFELF